MYMYRELDTQDNELRLFWYFTSFRLIDFQQFNTETVS